MTTIIIFIIVVVVVVVFFFPRHIAAAVSLIQEAWQAATKCRLAKERLKQQRLLFQTRSRAALKIQSMWRSVSQSVSQSVSRSLSLSPDDSPYCTQGPPHPKANGACPPGIAL